MAEAISIPVSPGALCPADFHPLSAVTDSTPAGVAAAVSAARSAQPAWAALPAAERERQVLLLCRRLLEQRAQGVRVLSDETGRGETECLMSELVGAIEIGKAAVRVSRKALAKEPASLSRLDYPGKRAYIEAVPRGVVGIIAPWNYPVGIFLKSLLPALLAGNGVVLKPSEHSPRSGQWLAEVCAQALPAGLVQIVCGGGAIGAALLEAGVDGMVFTGSVASGRKVSGRAGELLIPCSAELGGKDAAIVLADCDLERTVAGVLQWGFHNAGQNCAAIERVYVEDAIADAFVERLASATRKLRVAPAPAPAERTEPTEPTELGPMQNAMQLAIVEEHVKDAVDRGATLLAGGARTGRGLGYQPTLLDRCTAEMKVIRDETFGPVLAIVRVASAEEALKLANDSRYGLNGSVWTRDLKRGEALARRMEVGVALVNNHAVTGILPELPWTGVKESGPGTACSRYAYGVFVRRRAVLVDGSSKPDPWWMPANADLKAFGDALVARQLNGGVAVLLKLGGLVGKRVKAIKELAK
jgi:acyl-CoA reductase-like NAD-dependent aldehyde dehydrogenase